MTMMEQRRDGDADGMMIHGNDDGRHGDNDGDNDIIRTSLCPGQNA